MINPGQRVRIGGQVFRLRYITRDTYYFEPGDTKPSPFTQNDVLTISLDKNQPFEWEIAPEQPEWLELECGAIPVHPDTLVEVKMRNGATDGPREAARFFWYRGNETRDEMGCDIIAYREVSE